MIIAPESMIAPEVFTERSAISDAWAESMRRFRDALASEVVLDAGVLVGVPGSGKSTWCSEHDDPRIVLFDAVFSDPGRRRSMAGKIRRARKNSVAIWIRTPLSEAMERNAKRPAWRRVPESAIVRASEKIRKNPPSLAEGWHRVIVVR